MGEAGISKDIRDRIQNHALNDVSSKHYDRYDYLTEKRRALDTWEDRVNYCNSWRVMSLACSDGGKALAKYDLNSAEERYQPGSEELVLANRLGIIDEQEMEALESGLLLMLYERLFIEHKPSAMLTFEHISTWHRQWLGNVYEWAGGSDNYSPMMQLMSDILPD